MSAMQNHRQLKQNRRLSARIAQFAILALLLVLAGAPVQAHEEEPGGILKDVGFDPKPNQAVPLDLSFRDESGREVRLGDYFTGKPVILTLNYYNCPNLCPLVLDGLAEGLMDLPYLPGREFSVVTVSFDPRETPELAAASKERVLSQYMRSDAEEARTGWHFLTGEQAEIQRLADSVGFRYVYDEEQDDFAHPSGVVLLTPAGRVARYLFGMDFPERDLRLAIVEASQNKISTVVDQVLLLCYHYDELTGRYTATVMNFLRLGAALTVLGLGALVFTLSRRDRQGGGPVQGAGA